MDRELAQRLLCEWPFGTIHLPYVKMGRIDSLDLFGVTELIIMAFYWRNRFRYKKVLDIGANIGLHSILMDRLKWEVKAFEPDYQHYSWLLGNLQRNECMRVTPYMAAVHTSNGEMNFIRVLNNLTGNHLEGYKDSYGPMEKIIVPTVDCRSLFDWADFAKIDCEGNEAEILLTTTEKQMKHLDIIAEVRNRENAQQILDHFQKIEVPVWSQKNDWKQCTIIESMPHINREGSIFIGHKPPFEMEFKVSGVVLPPYPSVSIDNLNQ
jgi:FkbM family methyltransferase